jgi:hypothetical protein
MIGCTYFSEQFLHSISESTSRHLTKFQQRFEFVWQSVRCPELEAQNEEVFRNYKKIPYLVRHICCPHPEYAKFVLVSRDH